MPKLKRLPAFQEFNSANTSLNQVAATFGMVDLKNGGSNLDYGGGKYDKATALLSGRGVTNLVYDPFNRSEVHNFLVRQQISLSGGADTVTANNVLNVIREEIVVLDILRQTANGIRADGTAWFLLYDGDKSGVGRATTRGWQRNERAASYVPLIQTAFESVKVKGSLIEACNPIYTPNSLFDQNTIQTDIRKSMRRCGIPVSGTKNPTGKRMGDFLYLHRSAGRCIPDTLLVPAMNKLPKQFHFDVMKWNMRNGSLSFIESPDFDDADEPRIGRSIMITPYGGYTLTPAKKDPQIYHHKWSFVYPDYSGFSVFESQMRSLSWSGADGIDKSRIGTLSLWVDTANKLGIPLCPTRAGAQYGTNTPIRALRPS